MLISKRVNFSQEEHIFFPELYKENENIAKIKYFRWSEGNTTVSD